MAMASAGACPSVGSGVGASARPSGRLLLRGAAWRGAAAWRYGRGARERVRRTSPREAVRACGRLDRLGCPTKTGRAVRLPARRAHFFLPRAPRGEQRDCWTGWGCRCAGGRRATGPQKRPVQARLRCAVSRLGCPTALPLRRGSQHSSAGASQTPTDRRRRAPGP